MSDLDRYLTDELVEKAAQTMADDWDPERYPVLAAMFRDYAQTALSAVVPDIIRQAKAEALARLGRAALTVDSKHHIHGTTCLCGFTGDARKRTQTEHITTAVLEAYDHD